ALGLAVPIVQVVAARRLFENGVMVRDGAAMERLAEADFAIFDKTGTLTLGKPRLVNTGDIDPDWLEAAAELGAHSRHPLSQAIAAFAGEGGAKIRFTTINEIPGQGVEGHAAGAVWRLGRGGWAGNGEGTLLGRDGVTLAAFSFEDKPRADARPALAVLKSELGPVEMLSGDTEATCRTVASDLEIETYASGLLPAQKVARIEELTALGKKPLMVGDGLNDATALGAAYVSMAPATAADVGRNADEFVFPHE